MPDDLPPPIEYSTDLALLVAEAERSLGAAAHIADSLPEPKLITEPFIRMEAVLSSRIEGTQTTPEELFQAEAIDIPLERRDTRETVNYVQALEWGHAAVRARPLDLNQDLACRLHRRLFEGIRDGSGGLGRYREATVWLGRRGRSIQHASYVPPPWQQVQPLMADWERYVADCLQEAARVRAPRLVQCAVLHVQFEMIHPFIDGNGRVGRLLAGLFLVACGHLSEPLLLLSPYLEANRHEYYDRLLAISEAGDWSGWLTFFLEAVRHQSDRTLEAARSLMDLRDRWRAVLQQAGAPAYVLALADELFRNPYTTTRRVQTQLGVSFPTAQKALRQLAEHGLVEEITGQKRNQRFCATEVLRAIAALE